MSRPDPVAVQEDLKAVINLYPAARDLAAGAASSGALGDFTTGGTVSDLSDIINVALSATLREIASEIYAYAKILTEADRTPPESTGTVALTRWLSQHIGYFTHGDDAQLGWAFADDVKQWRHALEVAADPGGRVPIDTHQPCFEDGCPGTYRIVIDRDKPLPYDLAAQVLRGKDARCSADREHVVRVEMLPQVRRWEARA